MHDTQSLERGNERNMIRIGWFCPRRSTYSNWYLKAYFRVKTINFLFDQRRKNYTTNHLRIIHHHLLYLSHARTNISSICNLLVGHKLHKIQIIVIMMRFFVDFGKCGSWNIFTSSSLWAAVAAAIPHAMRILTIIYVGHWHHQNAIGMHQANQNQ